MQSTYVINAGILYLSFNPGILRLSFPLSSSHRSEGLKFPKYALPATQDRYPQPARLSRLSSSLPSHLTHTQVLSKDPRISHKQHGAHFPCPLRAASRLSSSSRGGGSSEVTPSFGSSRLGAEGEKVGGRT
mmetsp:Transcript_25138/g.56746  ORF Transcript_25138/g.56746 Transcript_25138/m.56746 type:complete len:131 (+) Transcript_25138:48-440(+)